MDIVTSTMILGMIIRAYPEDLPTAKVGKSFSTPTIWKVFVRFGARRSGLETLTRYNIG